MNKTIVYTNFVNYKGGINNLIVCFDNFGISGKSQKDVQTAYRNYLRNRTRANKKALAAQN